MHHLVELIEKLRNRDIGFRSVSDGFIDTTSASGELIFHVFSSLAQFERRLIQERTNAGLVSARARGRLGGRPPIDLDEAKVRTARKLHDDQTLTIDDICQDANHLTVHVFPIRADEEEVTASVSQRSFLHQSQNPGPLTVSPEGYRKLRRFLGMWASASRDPTGASAKRTLTGLRARRRFDVWSRCDRPTHENEVTRRAENA